MDGVSRPRGARSPVAALGRMPTGAKVFLILSGALLPLALIAFFATLQTTRTADLETRARVGVAAHESARALRVELNGDMTVLRTVLEQMAADPGDTAGCARAEGLFAQQGADGAGFVIRGRKGELLCGNDLQVEIAPSAEPGRVAAHIVAGRGLSLHLLGRSGCGWRDR